MKKILAILLAAVFVISCFSTTFAEESFGGYTPEAPLVLKAGHQDMTDEGSQALVMKYIKEYLEEKTNGAITMEIYGASQLGDDKQMAESVSMGTLDMSAVSTSSLASFNPEWEVLDIQYLFSGWDAVKSFLGSDVIMKMGALTEPQGLMVVGMFPVGFRSIGSNGKGIQTPEDIKGMKIRVIGSQVMMDSFKAFGANPVTLANNEIVPAMEQKTVDAFETVDAVFYTNSYECIEYVSLTQHMMMLNGIAFSKATFDKLDESVQNLILEAVKEATLKSTNECEENTNHYLDLLETERGITVIRDVDKAAFIALIEDYNNGIKESGKFTYLEDILSFSK